MSKKIWKVYYCNQRLNALAIKFNRLKRELKTVKMVVLKTRRFRFFELFKNINIQWMAKYRTNLLLVSLVHPFIACIDLCQYSNE